MGIEKTKKQRARAPETTRPFEKRSEPTEAFDPTAMIGAPIQQLSTVQRLHGLIGNQAVQRLIAQSPNGAPSSVLEEDPANMSIDPSMMGGAANMSIDPNMQIPGAPPMSANGPAALPAPNASMPGALPAPNMSGPAVPQMSTTGPAALTPPNASIPGAPPAPLMSTNGPAPTAPNASIPGAPPAPLMSTTGPTVPTGPNASIPGAPPAPLMSTDPNAPNMSVDPNAPASSQPNMSTNTTDPNTSGPATLQPNASTNAPVAPNAPNMSVDPNTPGAPNMSVDPNAQVPGAPPAPQMSTDPNAPAAPNMSVDPKAQAPGAPAPNMSVNPAATGPQNASPNTALPGAPNAPEPEENVTDPGTTPAPPTNQEPPLVDKEIAEHQRWGAVGPAESAERAKYVASTVGLGALKGAGEGLAMGAGIGLGTKGFEWGAAKAIAKWGPRIAMNGALFKPVPVIGALIGGGFAVRSMATRDWGSWWTDMGNFNKGKDTYDRIANTLQAVSQALEVAANVANIIAGLLGIISAGMWVFAVATAGVLSPLAASFTSIAATIGIAANIVDVLNQGVLQPVQLMFRSLQLYKENSDPEGVAKMGQKLSDLAAGPASALGAHAGGKFSERVTKGKTPSDPKDAFWNSDDAKTPAPAQSGPEVVAMTPAGVPDTPTPASRPDTPTPASLPDTPTPAALPDTPTPAALPDTPTPASLPDVPTSAADTHTPAAAADAHTPAAAADAHTPAAAADAHTPAAMPDTPTPAAMPDTPTPASVPDTPTPASIPDVPTPAAAPDTPIEVTASKPGEAPQTTSLPAVPGVPDNYQPKPLEMTPEVTLPLSDPHDTGRSQSPYDRMMDAGAEAGVPVNPVNDVLLPGMHEGMSTRDMTGSQRSDGEIVASSISEMGDQFKQGTKGLPADQIPDDIDFGDVSGPMGPAPKPDVTLPLADPHDTGAKSPYTEAMADTGVPAHPVDDVMLPGMHEAMSAPGARPTDGEIVASSISEMGDQFKKGTKGLPSDQIQDMDIDGIGVDPTPAPMVSDLGGDLRLSYPNTGPHANPKLGKRGISEDGGPFRYESGPQPKEGNPFKDLTDAEIDASLAGLDALGKGGEAPAGSVDAGPFQQVDIAPFEPMKPYNDTQLAAMTPEQRAAKEKLRYKSDDVTTYKPDGTTDNRGWQSPLSPPAKYGYDTPGAPINGPHHGASGNTTLGADKMPQYNPAEIFSVTSPHETYAVRGGPAGSYVDHIFNTKAEAEAYAKMMSERSEAQIRDQSAIKKDWNPLDAYRIFPIPPNTPYLRSSIAPQFETALGSPARYEGGGPQIQIPYGTTKKGGEIGTVPIKNRHVPKSTLKQKLGWGLRTTGRFIVDKAKKTEQFLEQKTPEGIKAKTPESRLLDFMKDGGSAAIDWITGDQEEKKKEGQQVTVPVVPDYAPPPGTPQQVQAMGEEIVTLQGKEGEAAQMHASAAREVKKGEENDTTMKEVVSGTKESIDTTTKHGQLTSQRTQVNQQALDKQNEAQQTAGSYAEKAAGLGTLKTMLRGFLGLLPIAEYIPSDRIRGLARKMGGDASKFLGQLTSADTTMAGLNSSQGAQKSELQQDKKVLAQTQAENAQNQQKMVKAQEGALAIQNHNSQRTDNADKVRERAAQQRSQIKKDVQQRTEQKEALSQKIAAWAQGHQEARQQAAAQMQAQLVAQGYEIKEVKNV